MQYMLIDLLSILDWKLMANSTSPWLLLMTLDLSSRSICGDSMILVPVDLYDDAPQIILDPVGVQLQHTL